jgi:uncharacterized protein (TIGR02444 family)
MADHQISNEIWTFATKFYERPDIAEACLALQAKIDANVNIVLFSVFVIVRYGASLSEAEVERLERHVEDWHRTVVLPLRILRNELKTKPELSSFGVSSALRQDIKALELRAERIELETLALCLHPESFEPGPPDPVERLTRLIKRFQRRELSRADADAIDKAVRLLAEQASRAASEYAEQIEVPGGR